MPLTYTTALPQVAFSYAQALKIPVTKTVLRSYIEENPFYPSLFSLTEAFEKLNVPTTSYKIDQEQLYALDCGFIAFMNIPGTGDDFVFVDRITDDTVTYFYKTKKQIQVDKETFSKQFKDIILLAEPTNNSGDPDFRAKLKEEKQIINIAYCWKIFLAVIVILLFSLRITAENKFFLAPIFITKVIGCLSTIFMLLFDLNSSNPFIKSLCGGANKKTGCDSVLQSNASKFLGINWSEIGFVYFMSSSIILLLPFIQYSNAFEYIALLNLLVFPYIFYSIYFQLYVIKRWCTLCLIVQACLFLEASWSIVYYLMYGFEIGTSLSECIALIVCFLTPIVALAAVKPYLVKAKKYQLYYNSYKRLHFNDAVFYNLLSQQDLAPDGWQDIGITFGNPEAGNTILKVCNPYCGPCAKAHPILEEIIHKNQDVNLKIIFTSSLLDRGFHIVKQILNLKEAGDYKKMSIAMDDWYSSAPKDYSAWCKRNHLPDTVDAKINNATEMHDWCKIADIEYTPTFFVNGYKMPENYDITDLKRIF